MGLILPNLPLGLVPVLNGSPVQAASLLVQFIGTFGDLWSHIVRFPGDEVKNAPFDQGDFHWVASTVCFAADARGICLCHGSLPGSE